MAEAKKRKAVYNREADMKYISNLSADEKAEKSRRAAFTRARNFIRDKKYTEDELMELKQLIVGRENKSEGIKMNDEKLLKQLLDTNLEMKELIETRTHAENAPDKYDYLPYWWAIWAYDFELECGDEPEAPDFKEALADIA